MSANIINKSGSTSTFIPGGTGSSGTRAAVTFYGTHNEESPQYPITFMLNDSSVVTISNIYENEITPNIGDCIIYSEPNNTYLLYITSKEQNYYKVSISEVWNTQSKSGEQGTDISNIKINVTCVNYIHQTYHGFKSNISDKLLYSEEDQWIITGFKGDTNPDSLYINSVCGFTFNIKSENTLPLGEYKIQMEFITDWISPGMDTKIAKKFQTQKIYSGLDNYTDTGEKCTLRGYITNYSCKGTTEEYSTQCSSCGSTTDIQWINGWWATVCSSCGYTKPLPKNPDVVSENFDDEKLDNFEVTIKDYLDGVGEQSYQTTTFIPIDVLKNAYNAGHPYKCLLYLYVNGTNGSKEKIFMKDMSSAFNNAVNEADSSIHELYSGINPQ